MGLDLPQCQLNLWQFGNVFEFVTELLTIFYVCLELYIFNWHARLNREKKDQTSYRNSLSSCYFQSRGVSIFSISVSIDSWRFGLDLCCFGFDLLQFGLDLGRHGLDLWQFGKMALKVTAVRDLEPRSKPCPRRPFLLKNSFKLIDTLISFKNV